MDTQPGKRLPRRARKVLLILHVVVSVSWLGLDLAILALGITGLTTGDETTLRAAYVGMRVLTDALIVPAALLTLITGVVLGAGTRWGLARYWWVLVKFLLTLGAATATVFALRPMIIDTAGRAAGTHPADLGGDQASLIAAPSVALVIYLVCTVLSYVKPWGLTPKGRRDRRRARTVSGRAGPARQRRTRTADARPEARR